MWCLVLWGLIYFTEGVVGFEVGELVEVYGFCGVVDAEVFGHSFDIADSHIFVPSFSEVLPVNDACGEVDV